MQPRFKTVLEELGKRRQQSKTNLCSLVELTRLALKAARVLGADSRRLSIASLAITALLYGCQWPIALVSFRPGQAEAIDPIGGTRVVVGYDPVIGYRVRIGEVKARSIGDGFMPVAWTHTVSEPRYATIRVKHSSGLEYGLREEKNVLKNVRANLAWLFLLASQP